MYMSPGRGPLMSIKRGTASVALSTAGKVTITPTSGQTVEIASGDLVLGAAVNQIVPGATSLSLRNHADDADNLILTDAGVGTVRAGLVVTAGQIFLGDTANAFGNQSITINQGTNTDEILTFKGTDISHGMTGGGGTETDSFAVFKKSGGANGGLAITAFSEATEALVLSGNQTTATTVKSTAGRSAIRLIAGLKSGNSTAGVSADGNLMNLESAGTTRFIWDTEGSGHADVEWTTYDVHDDLALIADIEAALLSRETVDQTERRLALQEVGIISAESWHLEDGKPRAMVNFTRLAMLHHGALIQTAQRFAALEAKVLALQGV